MKFNIQERTLTDVIAEVNRCIVDNIFTEVEDLAHELSDIKDFIPGIEDKEELEEVMNDMDNVINRLNELLKEIN